MNKTVLNIANALIAGLAGAAIFFTAAYYLHWGGINGTQDRPTVTIPTATAQLTQPASTSTGATMGPEEVFQKYADSAVQIESTFDGVGGGFFHANNSAQGIGSGFVVSSDGYILTNGHVIVDTESGSAPVKASKVQVNFRNGKQAEASIVGYDLTSSDIAVIKVDPSGLDLLPAQLGDSESVRVGETVAAIGSPFGLYSSSITAGIVSAINRTVESPESGFVINNAIQTDAAINRGNSGGPLFNMRGEVIGLNEQIATTSGGSEGVGFAVPINTAKRVMQQIVEKGSVEYAWMGVVGQSLDPEAARGENLSVTAGALLSDVQSGGPAEKAGLAKGDVIIKIDDKDIKTMEDVSSILSNRKPGDKVKVTYVRGSDTKEVEIELGTRPSRL